MRPLVRPAHFLLPSKHGEHVRRNTKPNKRKSARRGRFGSGHQFHPDHGTSQFPSTQAFGVSVIRILSCSKSGLARAGPGSKYTSSVALSPMGTRWADHSLFARGVAGGYILPLKRHSTLPPTTDSNHPPPRPLSAPLYLRPATTSPL